MPVGERQPIQNRIISRREALKAGAFGVLGGLAACTPTGQVIETALSSATTIIDPTATDQPTQSIEEIATEGATATQQLTATIANRPLRFEMPTLGDGSFDFTDESHYPILRSGEFFRDDLKAFLQESQRFRISFNPSIVSNLELNINDNRVNDTEHARAISIALYGNEAMPAGTQPFHMMTAGKTSFTLDAYGGRYTVYTYVLPMQLFRPGGENNGIEVYGFSPAYPQQLKRIAEFNKGTSYGGLLANFNPDVWRNPADNNFEQLALALRQNGVRFGDEGAQVILDIKNDFKGDAPTLLDAQDALLQINENFFVMGPLLVNVA